MTRIESEGAQVVVTFAEESENPEKGVFPEVEKGGGKQPRKGGGRFFIDLMLIV